MIPFILAGIGAYLVGSGLAKKKTNSYKDGGKMANGGTSKNWSNIKKSKIEDLKSEIEEINKYLKKLENQNTKEAYEEGDNLRKYKAILQAKLLHLEDESTMASGGKMAKGGEEVGFVMYYEPQKNLGGKSVQSNEEIRGNYRDMDKVLDKRLGDKYLGSNFYIEDGYGKVILKDESNKKEVKEILNMFDFEDKTSTYKKEKGGEMAKGGFVAVGEKDGYWTIMSKPTTKEKAQKVIDMGVPKGEVGKVVTLEQAKSHKKVIGEEYLASGGKMEKGGTTDHFVIQRDNGEEFAMYKKGVDKYKLTKHPIEARVFSSFKDAQSVIDKYNLEDKLETKLIVAKITKSHPEGLMEFLKENEEEFASGGKMADGGEVESKNVSDLIKEGAEKGSKKVKVVFNPAYNHKEHSKLSDDLKKSLKKSKVEFFDIVDESVDIVDLIKNKEKKDVKSISWVLNKK